MEDNKKYIKALNDLYISHRGKYLVQYPKGIYQTMIAGEKKAKNLCDGFLYNHFKGTHTYGVFAGGYGTKFMTFDVDTKENARYMTMKLVNTLVEEFGVPYKDIHVSFSGSKGYHVDLFFDFMQNRHIEVFYNKVIKEMGVDTSEIELRPTPSQGVKLPLGVHQKTGNTCWFVDTVTLEPIQDKDHILSIKPMSADDFLFIVYGDEGQEEVARQVTLEKSIEVRQRKMLDQVVSATDMAGKTIDECYAYAEEVLTLGQLKYPHTRHNTTLLLARYFNSKGTDKQLAMDMIENVIVSTPSEYFNKGTTEDFRLKEIKRIVDLAYERNYTIEGSKTSVEISKAEILEVLEVNKLQHKQVLLAMLIHSKRCAKKNGHFYMAYSTLNKMLGGNIKRHDLKKYIDHLVKEGLVEVISSNETDKEMTKILGKPYKKPNVYRMNIQAVESTEVFEVDCEGKIELVDLTVKIIPFEEMESLYKEKVVSKSQYYNTFKPMYEVSC